jgi:DNA methylase
VCGAPWERVVEASGGLIGQGWTDHSADFTKGSSQVIRADGGKIPYQRIEKGWQPTCAHYSNNDWMSELKPVVPATVFDPFAGSGTTLLVAQQLGRRGVGTELSAAYLQLARERLGQVALEQWESGVKADGDGWHGLPLFGGEP